MFLFEFVIDSITVYEFQNFYSSQKKFFSYFFNSYVSNNKLCINLHPIRVTLNL